MTKYEEINEMKEEICSKLRLTIAEYGSEAVQKAVLIGPYEYWDQVGGVQFIHSPTAARVTLGLVDYHVARFFEDVDGGHDDENI